MTAPKRPQDARTFEEALEGLQRSMQPRWIKPRFDDTRGSWVRVGAHACRIPQNAIVTVIRASNEREIGLVAGTVQHDGKIWILSDTPNGVRELDNVPEDLANELRVKHFG